MFTGNESVTQTNSNTIKQVLVLWLPVVAWALVIFYFSSQPNLRINPDNLTDFILRKSAHMFVFGVLNLLIFRALGLKRWWVALVLTILYAISDEWHQSMVPMRHATYTDVLFDTTGAIIAFGVYALSKRHLHKP